MKNYWKILLVVAFAINFFLAGQFLGYDIGLTDAIGFSISGQSGYELLAICYFDINFLLLIFYFGLLIKNRILSSAICLAALSLTFYFFRIIYLQKTLYYNNGVPVRKIVDNSIPLDLISFSIIVLFLVLQVINSTKYIFYKNRNVLTTY